VPTYQYACTECGHAFEQVQSFSDDALTVCPVCSGRLRKVFNAVGVVFKGSGFYRTDSRAGSSASVPAGAGEKGGDKGGDKAAASSDGSSSTSTTASSTSSSGSGSSSSAGTSSATSAS
jgi:putative FmdB family regulatory protein